MSAAADKPNQKIKVDTEVQVKGEAMKCVTIGDPAELGRMLDDKSIDVIDIDEINPDVIQVKGGLKSRKRNRKYQK